LDSQGTLDRVCKQLDDLLVVSRARRAEEAQKAVAEALARQAAEKAMANPQPRPDEGAQPSDPVPHRASQEPVEAVHEAEELYARRVTVSARGVLAARQHYVECDPASSVAALDPNAFFDRAYDEYLQAMVAFVVEEEGPILDLALARRISRAHGWQRTGSRIQERVEEVARCRFKTTDEDVGTFYWPEGLPPNSVVTFRPPGADAQRSMDEVCMEELVGLAALVVSAAAKDEDNLVLMARELGISRLRASSRGRLEEALRRFRAHP